MSMKFTRAEQPDADMVVISRGRKHLYVHKQNLDSFSAYFRKTIQSWKDAAPQYTVGDLPAMLLDESRPLLVRMLEYAYPTFTGKLEYERKHNAEEFMEALVFIDKYNVSLVIRQVYMDAFRRYLDGEETSPFEQLVLYKANVPSFLVPMKDDYFSDAAAWVPWNRKAASAKDISPAEYPRLLAMKRQTSILANLVNLDDELRDELGCTATDSHAQLNWKFLLKQWREHHTLLAHSDFTAKKRFYSESFSKKSSILLNENLDRLEGLLIV